ncbi:MAG: hypothetical protein WCO09_01540 [bacterium]
MILTTHAVTGATLATLMPNNPILGFIVGFGSHFVLDSIPHWDYSLKSSKIDKQRPLKSDIVVNKDFFKDLIKIGLDAVLGLTLSLLLLGVLRHQSILIILCGAIGGMTPDFLQFVYFKWRHEPLISLQKFHGWMHAKSDLDDRPILGILSQMVVIAIVFVLF